LPATGIIFVASSSSHLIIIIIIIFSCCSYIFLFFFLETRLPPSRSSSRSLYRSFFSLKTIALHVLELIDTTLCVTLADLAERLVLVTSLANVLAMDLVVCRLFRLVARLRQILFQSLEINKILLILYLFFREFCHKRHNQKKSS